MTTWVLYRSAEFLKPDVTVGVLTIHSNHFTWFAALIVGR